MLEVSDRQIQGTGASQCDAAAGTLAGHPLTCGLLVGGRWKALACRERWGGFVDEIDQSQQHELYP